MGRSHAHRTRHRRGGEPRRRWRRDRRRGSCACAARRTHLPHGQYQHSNHCAGGDDAAALRSAQGFFLDLYPVHGAQFDRRARIGAGTYAARTDRLCQSQSRQIVLRLRWHRHCHQPHRRTVQAAHRRAGYRAHSLQRVGARRDRPRQRPHPDDDAEHWRTAARASPRRQSPHSRGDVDAADQGGAGHSDRDRGRVARHGGGESQRRVRTGGIAGFACRRDRKRNARRHERPEFRTADDRFSFEPLVDSGPDEATRTVREEIARWTPVIKSTGFRME
jgi:hypothetical protein